MQRILAFPFMLAHFALCAQNLVPNPGFEENLSCPAEIGEIETAIGWTSIGISPDYFNECADDSVGVPFNALGYQWPADGTGYAGLSIGPLAQNKEYMQAELTEPLAPGEPTYVSVRVSPGGFGMPDWTSPTLAVSHVGLRFSVAPLQQFAFYGQFHFNTAALYMPTVLSDTSSWTVLAGVYVPDSAYRYLQIGSFFDENFVQQAVLDPNDFGWEVGYAFVDMVCVAKIPGVCDQVISVPDAESHHMPRALMFNRELVMELRRWGIADRVVSARLFDAMGRTIVERAQSGLDETTILELPVVGCGAYSLVLSLRDGTLYCIRAWKVE